MPPRQLSEKSSNQLSEATPPRNSLQSITGRATIFGGLIPAPIGFRKGTKTTNKEQSPMAVKPIPEGYSTATPYLIIKDAARAITFYKQAFGASELMRFADPSGKVGHAEIKIGNSPIMLADEHPDMGYRSPQALGGTPVSILLYVEEVDARFRQALAAGAKETRPVQDQFYGDRSGTLVDPFGHVWTLATHKEDVSLEEVRRRFETMMKKQAKT
jgi:PhnB protein